MSKVHIVTSQFCQGLRVDHGTITDMSETWISSVSENSESFSQTFRMV